MAVLGSLGQVVAYLRSRDLIRLVFWRHSSGLWHAKLGCPLSHA